MNHRGAQVLRNHLMLSSLITQLIEQVFVRLEAGEPSKNIVYKKCLSYTYHHHAKDMIIVRMQIDCKRRKWEPMISDM